MRTFLAMLFCLSFSASAANDHPAQVAGIYEGSVPVKSGDARKVTLNLLQNGNAQWKDGATTSSGQWSVSGEQLALKLETGGRNLTWKIKKNSLALEGSERANYGKKGLLLRRPR